MARKDVPDLLVCQAYSNYKRIGEWPMTFLKRLTGEPEKVIWRAMERSSERGFINYGVSLAFGWLTDKGEDLIARNGERPRIL